MFGKWEDDSPYASENRTSFRSELSITRKLFPNRLYFQDISSLLIDKEVMYILSQITDPYSDMIEIIAWTGFSPHLVEYSIQTQEGDGKRITFQDQSISLEYSEGIYSPKTFKTSFSIGLLLATLGVLTTAGFIIAQDYYQTFIPDWWMLISVIIFIVGVLFGLVGLFGEQKKMRSVLGTSFKLGKKSSSGRQGSGTIFSYCCFFSSQGPVIPMITELAI